MKLFVLHVAAFCYRNLVFARRNVFVVVEMLFWPVLGILSIGLMGGFLRLGDNALAFVLTGAVASGVLQVAQLDVGYSLLYDVWSKSVKHTFLTPAGLPSALMGAWIVGVARGLVIFFVLALTCRFCFGFHLPGLWPTLIFLAGVFWTALLAGIVVWILILNYGQRAEITVWAITYLIMILCGIYYPVDLLSAPFFLLSRMIPLTYFLDAVRSQYGFTPLFPNGLWIGWGLNLAYLAVGLFFAEWAMQRARRTGLLVRLSE